MRIIETKVYTIDEHPNKDLCYEWIRDNWHDLNEYSVDEFIKSIKALSELIGGTVDFSISAVPDRGEHITFKDYDHEKLCRISADDCPLTGVCWDIDIIEGLRTERLDRALGSLHDDTDYVYSDAGLKEMCEANEYEFNETGKCI